MGGVRLTRITRPVALLSAMATLLAALFLCLAAGGGEHLGRPHGPLADGPAQYSCPSDQGGCGLHAHSVPAVLTTPPTDAPTPAAVHGLRPVTPRAGAAAVRFGARPRAPDLHVLQVLRT
ncbi:hypothetical protein DT019_05985 [Streptomyces sp. SDr-06]|uniref:hypothetical protein n=1 Tax=Streptomyces sp. SDr-06 TaxID=2267702 RepID=UPI000DE84FF1|nr:hypothetical protein [Streptomyces sp. SDr-06]RCH69445.1 hypothetical protein DT019_05985 [Streptomyces sp. SDr-06]